MSSKLNRPQRRLDGKDGVTLGGGGIIETGGGAPSPGIVILTAPQSFTIVSTALAASLLVPKAIANTTWKRPLAPGPVGSYLIQWSLSSSFTIGSIRDEHWRQRRPRAEDRFIIK